MRKRSGFLQPGFTLIELLVVIAVIGILILAVSPNIGAGLSATKLTTAARSVVQAARYARTMALLHQTNTELVLRTDTGAVEVRAAHGNGGEPTDENGSGDNRIANRQLLDDSAMTGENGEGSDADLPSHVATRQTFANEVAVCFDNDGSTFRFLGYTDSVATRTKDKSANEENAETAPIIVSFESNGRCRPFKVRVIRLGDGEEDEYMDVSIDVTGQGKIDNGQHDN